MRGRPPDVHPPHRREQAPEHCVSSVLVPLTDRSAIAASGEVEPQLPVHYRSIVALSSLRSQTWSQRGPLHVLMLPDFERADRIGEFWGYPESRAFAELLIDCEEDRVLRAVLVGMLREADR